MRDGAPWCTQCYASLLPAETSLPPAQPATVDPPAPPRVAAQVAVQLLPEERRAAPAEEATWPCTTCGTANALADAACTGCGAPFLSALRAGEAPLLELPGVGDVTALSRGQRLGLGLAVVVTVVALTLLLGLLTG